MFSAVAILFLVLVYIYILAKGNTPHGKHTSRTLSIEPLQSILGHLLREFFEN